MIAGKDINSAADQIRDDGAHGPAGVEHDLQAEPFGMVAQPFHRLSEKPVEGGGADEHGGLRAEITSEIKDIYEFVTSFKICIVALDEEIRKALHQFLHKIRIFDR